MDHVQVRNSYSLEYLKNLVNDIIYCIVIPPHDWFKLFLFDKDATWAETRETTHSKVHVLKQTKFVPLMDHVQVKNNYSLLYLEIWILILFIVYYLHLMTD